MSVPTTEDLMHLRDMTRMTGTLTNVQIAQLKMWPQVILGARKAEIEFDPDTHLVIAFISDLDYGTMMAGITESPVLVYNRRMARFDEAVKWLLGGEYGVRIVLKDKTIADFPPKSAPVKKSYCESCAATEGKACPKHPIKAQYE